MHLSILYIHWRQAARRAHGHALRFYGVQYRARTQIRFPYCAVSSGSEIRWACVPCDTDSRVAVAYFTYYIPTRRVPTSHDLPHDR